MLKISKNEGRLDVTAQLFERRTVSAEGLGSRGLQLSLGLLAVILVCAEDVWAQVTLSSPPPSHTVTATLCPEDPKEPCTAPIKTAPIEFEVNVSGAAFDKLVLIFTPDSSSGLGFEQSLCTPRDEIEQTGGCPRPPITLKRTLNIQVGVWNVVARVTRGTSEETAGPVRFTVLSPDDPTPGAVSLFKVEAERGYPGIRLRKPSAAFPTGILTPVDTVKIIGRNLDNNPSLKVFLAPQPYSEPSLQPESALPLGHWCLFEAKITGKQALSGGDSQLSVELPELPLVAPSECLPPIFIENIFAKKWRWVVRDGWVRPGRVHNSWALPSPRVSDPSHGGPAFRVIQPPYPLIHGFGFENKDSTVLYNEFLTVFGNSAYHCVDCVPFFGCACILPRIPDPIYHLVWWPVYSLLISESGGSCNGMASTSLLMARGDLKPESFDSDVIFAKGFTSRGTPATYRDTSWCTPFCSPPKPDNLWATIRMNHGVQFSREFLTELLDTVGEAIFNPDDLTTIKGVPNATLDRVRNEPRGFVICMTEPGGGHCVTPYRVDEDNKIWIYDNNAPGDISRYIQITDGDYDYPARRNVDRKSPNRGNGIFAYPISIWNDSRHVLGLTEVDAITDFLSLITVGRADMIVTNKNGSRWGWEDDGKFTDSYFGALAIPPLGQHAEKRAEQAEKRARAMLLLIAMNQPAPTVQITADGGQYYFHAAENGSVFQIEAAHAIAGDKDQVRLLYLNQDLASFEFTPQRNADKIAPRVGLKLSEGQSGVFQWCGLTVPAGKTIEIGADRTTKSVSYRNSTGSATNHLLVLDAAAQKYARMIYGPFEVPNGANHRVVLKDWPKVSKVVSETDLDGDGKPDRSEVMVGYRAFPPSPAGGPTNLKIEKITAPGKVNLNQEVTYRFVVANDGPQNATGATLVSRVPPNLAKVSSARATNGQCTILAGRVACTLGRLAAGKRSIITYRVKANRSGTLALGSTVFSQQWDPNSTDNSILVTTRVR